MVDINEITMNGQIYRNRSYVAVVTLNIHRVLNGEGRKRIQKSTLHN